MEHTLSSSSLPTVTFASRLNFRRFPKDISGAAAIEFAFIAPILCLMLLCMVDLGVGIYHKMRTQNAAQAGAQYAMLYGFNADAISNAVLNATNTPGLTASPAPTEFCGCPSASGITTASCSSSIACSGTAAHTYVTVSAHATYTTLLPYPLLPDSFTFISQSTVRTQ